MTILHIAHIHNSSFSGVCVIVPQHIGAQKKYATVGLLNISNKKIDALDNQFTYQEEFDINDLPSPYNKPDIVIIHEVYHKEYLKIGKNLKKNGIPYVIIPHGSLVTAAQKKKKLKKVIANTLFFNRFIKNAIALQCLSENEKKDTKFQRNKFIGTNGISMPSKTKESFNDDITKFVYIGRLEEHVKGLDILIKAVASIKDFLIENNCMFYIYGPDYKGRYARVERLIKDGGVENLVCLSEAVIGDQKENIMLDSDIFIQTSRTEGMPLGILEALSHGVPCLITEGTNMGDMVARYNAGWIARTSVESVAEQIKNAVLSKNEWDSKAHNAVDLIKENFDWTIVGESTIEKYRALLKR